MKTIINLIAPLTLLISTNTFAFISPSEPNDIADSYEDSFNYEDSFFQEGEIIPSPSEAYTILKRLGEGAFGVVYAVEDSSGGKFALKSYRGYSDPYFIDSILSDASREFSRGQVLDHPNIIKSFDLFTYKTSYEEITNNVVLQLVEGKTVYDTNRGELTGEESLEAALNLCYALKYAYTQDMIYLDLHARNVMLSDEHKLMIVDVSSFFSADEFYTSYSAYMSQENSYTDSEGNKSIMPLAGSFIEPLHQQKMNRFFKNNPEVVKQMQEREKIQNHPALKGSTNWSDQTYTLDMTPIHSYYFKDITGICNNLINKSTLPRNDRINMRVEVKKLAWNYQEDVEEGQSITVDYYLNQLIELLESLPTSVAGMNYEG